MAGRAAAIALATGAMVGCETGPGPKGDLGPAPDYETIAAGQNDRVDRIEAYWATASVELQWTDEQGQRRTENGDGYLIFMPPDRTALSVTKLGETYLWAGSDAERFWLFEGGDADRAYIGRTENAFQPCAEPLPLAVHPSELLDLLGVFRFPAEDGRVREADALGAWVVHVPGMYSSRQVYLDPATLLPVRVDLLDAVTGRPLVTAELEAYGRLNQRERPTSQQPLVPTRLTIRNPQTGDSARIWVREPADRPPNRPLNEQLFSFEAVRATMRPDEVVVLDAGCANPATVAD